MEYNGYTEKTETVVSKDGEIVEYKSEVVADWKETEQVDEVKE